MARLSAKILAIAMGGILSYGFGSGVFRVIADDAEITVTSSQIFRDCDGVFRIADDAGITVTSSLIISGCDGVLRAVADDGKILTDTATAEPPREILFAAPWRLIEIRTAEKKLTLDREKMRAEKMSEWFGLEFSHLENGDRISGIAAPNRYGAPCSFDGESGVSFGVMFSTKMLAFNELPEIKEPEFFNYLQRARQWEITSGGNLKLWLAVNDDAIADASPKNENAATRAETPPLENIEATSDAEYLLFAPAATQREPLAAGNETQTNAE